MRERDADHEPLRNGSLGAELLEIGLGGIAVHARVLHGIQILVSRMELRFRRCKHLLRISERVSVLTPGFLSPRFRDNVLQQAQPL